MRSIADGVLQRARRVNSSLAEMNETPMIGKTAGCRDTIIVRAELGDGGLTGKT